MKKFIGFVKKKKSGLSPKPSTPRSGLASGYEINEKDLSKLHRAASRGDESAIRQQLRKHDINELDRENRTALHLACANGHTGAVTLLVGENCKLNICDNEHRSPLIKALQCQQVKCASILLEHKVDTDIVDIVGNTALHYAVLIPSKSTVVQIFERGACLDTKNSDGCTPLILAVTKSDKEIVEFLINEGVNVDAEDHQGRTPLMIASSNGHIGLVKMLLQNDINIFKKDKTGWNADDHAIVNGHDACSHLIIEYSSQQRWKRSPPFYNSNIVTGPSIFSSPDRVVENSFALGGPASDKKDLPQNHVSETTPTKDVTTLPPATLCPTPAQENDLSDWDSSSCSSKDMPCNQLPADLPQNPVSETTPPKDVTTVPPATLCPTPEQENDLSDWDSSSCSSKDMPCNQLPADSSNNGILAGVELKDMPCNQLPADSSNNGILAGVELDMKYLTQPSEEKDLARKNAALQEEINALKQDLDQVKTSSQEKENRYIEEIRLLGEKVDDLRRELKMKEESLTETVLQYNGLLEALKTEAAMLSSNLEQEKQSKERLETEMNTNQTLKADAERSLQRERDDRLHSQDKLYHELSSMYEQNSSLSQQLSKIEAKSNDIQYELHKTLLSLREKTLLLETTQRDLAKGDVRIKHLERMLQHQKEELSNRAIKQDSIQERLAQNESANLQLHQQLEEAKNKFTNLYNKLLADTERQVQTYKEKNKDLINKSDELLEKLYKVESERLERESTLRQLKQELAVAIKKLSVCEASLEDIKLNSKVESDKKDKKLVDHHIATESRFEQKWKKSNAIQRESSGLRTRSQTNEKKLYDYETGNVNQNCYHDTTENDYLETKSGDARIKEKILQELNRSDTRMLDRGYGNVDIGSTRFSTVGVLARSMTDLKTHPAYIGAKECLAAYKKKNMI